MLFCSQCGARIPDNSKFCYKCGAKVVAPDWTETEELYQEAEIPQEQPQEDISAEVPASEPAAGAEGVREEEKTEAPQQAADVAAEPEELDAEASVPEETDHAEPQTSVLPQYGSEEAETAPEEEPVPEMTVPVSPAEEEPERADNKEEDAPSHDSAPEEAVSEQPEEVPAAQEAVHETTEDLPATQESVPYTAEDLSAVEETAPEHSEPEGVTAEAADAAGPQEQEQEETAPEEPEQPAEPTASQEPAQEMTEETAPEETAAAEYTEPSVAPASEGEDHAPQETADAQAGEDTEEPAAEEQEAAAAEPTEQEDAGNGRPEDSIAEDLLRGEPESAAEDILPYLGDADDGTSGYLDPIYDDSNMSRIEQELLKALEELRPVREDSVSHQSPAEERISAEAEAAQQNETAAEAETAAEPEEEQPAAQQPVTEEEKLPEEEEVPAQDTPQPEAEVKEDMPVSEPEGGPQEPAPEAEVQEEGPAEDTAAQEEAELPPQSAETQKSGFSGIEDFNAVELARMMNDEPREAASHHDSKPETGIPKESGKERMSVSAENLSEAEAKFLAGFDSDPFSGQEIREAVLPERPALVSVPDQPDSETDEKKSRGHHGENKKDNSSSKSGRKRTDKKKKNRSTSDSKDKKSGISKKNLIMIIAALLLAGGLLWFYLSRPETQYSRHMRRASDAESRGDTAAACEEYNLALSVMPDSLQASEKLAAYWASVSEEIDEHLRRSQYREAAEKAKILKVIYPERTDETGSLQERIYSSWAAASVMTGSMNDVNYVLDQASAELNRESYEKVVARSDDAKARYKYAEQFTQVGRRILELNEAGDRTAAFEQTENFFSTVADYAAEGGSFPVRTGADSTGRQAGFYINGSVLQVYIGWFSDDGDREGTADSYVVSRPDDGTSEYDLYSCEWYGDAPGGTFRRSVYGSGLYDGEKMTVSGTLKRGLYDGTVTIQIPGGETYSATFDSGYAVVAAEQAPDGRKNVIGYNSDGTDWYCLTDEELNSSFGVLYVS